MPSPDFPAHTSRRRRGSRSWWPSCASRCAMPADAVTTPQAAVSGFGEEAVQGRRCAAPSSTSSTATSCRWCCRSACRKPYRGDARWRCTARCARSIHRPTCSISTSTTSTSSAPRRKSWCGSRTRAAARVTVRPIAGTRKRGATPEEDAALAADLLADPKERAEHLMLLDLGRNDVGRVAKTGTVRVTEQFIVERYSHVMHIVSNVEGRLKDDEGRARRAARDLPGRHGVRRAEGAGDGDHRRTGTGRSAASTPAPSATSASTATWISPSPSAPR